MNTLKSTQVKVASILGLLTRLLSIMEAEREILLDDNDKAVSGHTEITGLFEQTKLLIGQMFNTITYQKRLDVLNTLIDNSTRVKEF